MTIGDSALPGRVVGVFRLTAGAEFVSVAATVALQVLRSLRPFSTNNKDLSMNEQAFAAAISQTAQDVFRQPSIQFSSTIVFREIPGFDSILAIQFILAIESALDVTLNEDEVDNMHTMGDLMTLLRAKKG
ncbi:MAG: acyl carrier protein [Rhodopila sp.]